MNEALTYRLSAYEGPIDLLYSLIQAKKIDIFDIPIAELTMQYIDFLEKATDRDMDSMSEFTVLAATLLEIKSRVILPGKEKPDDEEDPRRELVDTLLEYRRAKLYAELFLSLETENDGVYFKRPETHLVSELKPKETIEQALNGITPLMLYKIYRDVLSKRELKVDKVRSSFKAVQRDAHTVEEKSEYILNILESAGRFSFKRLIKGCVSKMEMVVTFLAVLELIKAKEITVGQRNVFDDIELWKC